MSTAVVGTIAVLYSVGVAILIRRVLPVRV
jgi:hypothetical protein